ncbi:hypothetical protein ACFYY2_03530 [Streptomyces sp. NPDC001822]|uniref:hypothetical protein n=1 Tax=Streptomyces sp. NPDC001822 TaxID=3364614 RepID=UPI0036D0A310
MPAHFDDSQIRELGNQWIDDGLKLHEYLGTMHGSVQSMGGGWTGKAGRAAQLAWNGVADHNIWHAIWEAGYVAQEIGKAIIGYADELQKTIKEINRAHMIEALTAVFGMVLGIASFGIGALLSRVATMVGEIVESIVASISKLASAAAAIGRAAAFTADSVLNAAITLGQDVLATVLSSVAVKAPIAIDWQGEGINMGLSVWAGAGMGGLEEHGLSPHTITGKGLADITGPTVSPTPAPANISLPNTSSTLHNAIPAPTNLSPFNMNSVIETNHVPPTGAGIAGSQTGTPRSNVGTSGPHAPLPGNALPATGGPVKNSVTGPPGSPAPAVGTPHTPVKPVTATSGGQTPPKPVNGNVTPASGAPHAYLDSPPRSLGGGPGRADVAPSVPHGTGTGGKGTTAGGPGVRDEVPPSTAAASHSGGIGGPVPANTASSHGSGAGAGTSPGNATSHGVAGRGAGSAGNGSASAAEPDGTHTGPAGKGAPGRATAAPGSPGGSRPLADPVPAGGRGAADGAPGVTSRPGSPDVPGGTRPNHGAPQSSRGSTAPGEGGGSRNTTVSGAPDSGTAGRTAPDGRNQGAQPGGGNAGPKGRTASSQTSAESGVPGTPDRSPGSPASGAPGGRAVTQHDVGSGATAPGDGRPGRGPGRADEAEAGATSHGAAAGTGDASVRGRTSGSQTSGADDTAGHGVTTGHGDTALHGAEGHTATDAGAPPARDDSASGPSAHHTADTPAFDPDGAARMKEWIDYQKDQTQRNAPLVEAEARLELRTEELDAAWQRGFDRFTEQDVFGVANLTPDGPEAIHARWKWRKDITEAFRGEIDTSGFVSTEALNSIIGDAGNKAHKYLTWSDQATKFISRFKAEVSDFKSSGIFYRKELADFDSAPLDYVYDSRLKTYVRDDSKIYGAPTVSGDGPGGRPGPSGAGAPDGADIDVFTEYTGRSDVPVDHFRDKAADYNQTEQYFIGKMEQFNEVFAHYLHAGDQTTLPPSTRHQLDAVTSGMGGDLETIVLRDYRIRLMTGRKFDDVIAWQEKGNAGRDALSDDFVNRIRREFQHDLRNQYDIVFERGRGDTASGALWDSVTERAVDDLPGRIEREKFIRSKLSEETAHAEEHLSSLDESRIISLGEDGRQRVMGEYLDNVRDKAGALFSDLLDSGRTSADAVHTAWSGALDDVRSPLPHSIRHESELQGVVSEAAFEFHKIVGHPDSVEAFQIHEDTLSRLADDFRTERVVKYDELYGPDGHRTEVWLAHESAHEDGFRFVLDDLRREDTGPRLRTWRDDAPGVGGEGEPAPGTAGKTPAGDEVTAPGSTAADTEPAVPSGKSPGDPRPAAADGGAEPHGGQAHADAGTESSAHQQTQITVKRDTVGVAGTAHDGRPSGTAHSGGRERTAVPSEQKQARPAPKTVDDLPGAVGDWLRSNSDHTFSRAEIETAHQEILQQRTSSFSDMPLSTQAAEIGRALEGAASRAVRAASDMLLQQTGVYPDASVVRQAHRELAEHYGPVFRQLGDDQRAAVVAVHVRNQRDVAPGAAPVEATDVEVRDVEATDSGVTDSGVTDSRVTDIESAPVSSGLREVVGVDDAVHVSVDMGPTAATDGQAVFEDPHAGTGIADGHGVSSSAVASAGPEEVTSAGPEMPASVRPEEIAEALTDLRDVFGTFRQDDVPGWGVWKEHPAGDTAGAVPALTESGLGDAGRGVRQFFADKFGRILPGARNRPDLSVPANPDAPGDVPVDRLSDRDISRMRLNRAGDGVTGGVLSLHNAEDWSARQGHWGDYSGADGRFASMRPGALTSRVQPAPWGTDRAVYYVTAHGEYDKAKSYLLSGKKKIIDAQGMSRILRRDPVFSELSKKPVDVVLAICEAGLTGEQSMGQQLANELGVTVHAPNGEVAMAPSALHGTTLLTVYSQGTQAGTFSTFVPRLAAATDVTTLESTPAPVSSSEATALTSHAAPPARAGAGVHEDFPDLRFTAGLLDEKGVPRTDLLGGSEAGATQKDTQHAADEAAVSDSAPAASDTRKRRPPRLVLDNRPRVLRDYVVRHSDGTIATAFFSRVTPLLLSDDRAAASIGGGKAGPSKGLVTVVQGVVTDDHPDLHVSADGTLAMSTRGEVREAFATRGAVARASAALKQADSGVTLELDTSVTLSFTHRGRSRTLHAVRPKFASKPTDVCRDLAGELIGGKPDMIVYRGHDGRTAVGPLRGADGLKVSELHYLAQAVTDVAGGDRLSATTPDASWAAKKSIRPENFADPRTPLPGRTYGAYLGPSQPYRAERQALWDLSSQIGINAKAWAQVGEAYVSQSIGHRDPDGGFALEDHAGAFHSITNPFGYHYATAVLESEDGKTQVTLENYNRLGVTRRTFEQAVERNVEMPDGALEAALEAYTSKVFPAAQSAEERNAAAEAVAGREAATALIALRDARSALAVAQDTSLEPEAIRSAENAVRSAAAAASRKLVAVSARTGRLTTPGQLWHMRFVNKDHATFHDQMAGMLEQDRPGIVVNPLTGVAIGAHSDITESSRWIDFVPGSTGITGDDRLKIASLAHRVARVGLWNARNGRPLPTVQISAGGNGAESVLVPHREQLARKQASTRIDALKEVFRQELGSSLHDLQSGADRHSDIAVDAGQFAVTHHNRGRSFPQGVQPSRERPADVLRRRALFVIDMHPIGTDQPSPLAHTLEYLKLNSPVSAGSLDQPLSSALRSPTGLSSPRPPMSAVSQVNSASVEVGPAERRWRVTDSAAVPARSSLPAGRSPADMELLHEDVLIALRRMDTAETKGRPSEHEIADLYAQVTDTYKRRYPLHALAERIAYRWMSGEWPRLEGGSPQPGTAETVHSATGLLHAERGPLGLERKAVGRNVRWDRSWEPAKEPIASEADAVVPGMRSWDVPAAAVVERWAKAVAFGGEQMERDLVGMSPDSTAVGAGTSAGKAYTQATGRTAMGVGIDRLLSHTYDVPVAARTVTVGFDLISARQRPGTQHTASDPTYRQVADIGTDVKSTGPRVLVDFGVRVRISLPGQAGRLTVDVPNGLTASLPVDGTGKLTAEVLPKIEHLLRFRERVALAKRDWTGPVEDEIQHLQELLTNAGPGARSLVLGTGSDRALWAWNLNGTVRWLDNATAQETQPPLTSSHVQSLDLDPRGTLLRQDADPGVSRAGALNLCELTLGADLKHVV